MFAQQARALVVTAWAGCLWTVGYVVAPTLFAALDDRALAGMLAGRMFSAAHTSDTQPTALAMLTLALDRQLDAQRKKTLRMLVMLLVVVTLVNDVGLRPVMANLKAAGEMATFGKVHGASMVVYLIQSLMAAWLVLKNR